MGAFFSAAFAWFVRTIGAPAARWLGLELLRRATEYLKTLWANHKADKAKKERADRAQQGNSNYENNPTDDTFGDSP